MPVQKLGRRPPNKKLGQNMQNFGRFFLQRPTFIANILENQDIQNRKFNVSRSIPPAFQETGPMNFGPLITEIDVSLDPLKCTFWYTIFRPLEGAAP